MPLGAGFISLKTNVFFCRNALDELKIELLGGTLGPWTLMRLKSVTTDLLDASGDDRLDTVLAEIELRVAVEIAKMTPR